MTAKQYTYAKIDGHYYAVSQSILLLIYFLYVKYRSLGLYPPKRRKRIVTYLKQLFFIKLGLNRDFDLIKLPLFGHVCIPIHRGFKFFNFTKGSVTKLFDQSMSNRMIASEIEGTRDATRLNCAPGVIGWSTERHWIEEELINGSMGSSLLHTDRQSLMPYFSKEILPVLESMILLKNPVYTPLGDAVDRCVPIVDDERLSSTQLDKGKVGTVTGGIIHIADRLKKRGEDLQICMVFSHGDFSFKYVMVSRNRTMVIDWEGAAFRSVLFDLQILFFTELYYHDGSVSLMPEMSKAISMLKKRLETMAPDIANTFSSMTWIYRHLFYLERLTMLLQRDLSNKLLDVVESSYFLFMRYEADEAHHTKKIPA